MRIYCVYTDSEDLLFTAVKSEAKQVQSANESAVINSVDIEPEPGETLEAAYMRAEGQMLDGIKFESRAFLGII